MGIAGHHLVGLPKLSEQVQPVAAAAESAIQLVPCDGDALASAREPGGEVADGTAAASDTRSLAHAAPALNDAAHSHAISRAGWTARERRQGHPDRVSDRDVESDISGSNGLRERAARGAAQARPCGVEVFGGILRLSRAAERLALRTVGVIERDPYDLDYARRRFRCVTSADVLRREYELWSFSAEILYVLACAPCRIVATPGKQLGLDDPDAYVTVAAAADVANHFNAPFVVQENHANIVLLDNGSVMQAIDAAQRAGGRARTPIVDDAPLGAEFIHDSGMPELRHRVALHHEDVRLAHMISPCPRLNITCSTPLVINDILEPPALVDESLYVPGSLRVLREPSVYSRFRPTVAAVLSFGGPDCTRPLSVGERVMNRYDGTRQIFVVKRVDAQRGMCRMFVDDPHNMRELDCPVEDVQRVVHDINVHSRFGVAGTTTDFGVAPVFEDKQLILVDGRARRFTTTELYRLGGDEVGQLELRRLVPAMSESQIRRRHGKSLSMTLAEAMTRRLRERIDEFISVRDGHLLPYSDRPESKLASMCVSLTAAAAVVVFVLLTPTDTLVLVNASGASLPGVSRGASNEITHRNVIERVSHLTGVFESSIGYAPSALRAEWASADDTSSAHVVACPLGDDHPCSEHPHLRWMALRDVAQVSPELRDVASLAVAACSSKQTHK
jgi:site-specific DNA-cytosine methylase